MDLSITLLKMYIYIYILRRVIERSIEVQKDLYLCFIDFSKAFATVNHRNASRYKSDHTKSY